MFKNKNILVFPLVLLLFMISSSSLFADSDGIQPTERQQATIAQSFPDPAFAQAIADVGSGGDINAILTVDMIESIQNLEASNLGIENIEGIEILSNLRVLNLNNNTITSLPESLGLLNNLHWLHLDFNQLTSFPQSIGNLNNLLILRAEGNQISQLPSSFTQLSNLQNLQLGKNKLTELPENFDGLTSLRQLGLSYNLLTHLPESLGNLTNLHELYLYANQLTSLPSTFGKLSKLDAVFLGGNLLPSNYDETLNSLGLLYTFLHNSQDQLELKPSLLPYTITNGDDFDNIDLSQVVVLTSQRPLNPSHSLQLENYIDANEFPILLTDYLSNGVVQKEGVIYAQVRSTGTGLFPNNSDHAVTTDFIQLNFTLSLTYQLQFDLNGGTGLVPVSQEVEEGSKASIVPSPSKEGFTFNGWNSKADGSGMKWSFDSTLMPNHDVTLYAQWSRNITSPEETQNPSSNSNSDSFPIPDTADKSKTS